LNPYEVLSVSPGASLREIKRAYRDLAITDHPDKGGDPERWHDIQAAYDLLCDPEARAIYDETGRVPESKGSIDRQAEQMLKMIFDKVISSGQGFFDIAARMRAEIRGIKRKVEAEVSGAESYLRDLESYYGRFEGTCSALIAMVILERKQGAESRRDSAAESIRVCEAAALLVADLKDLAAADPFHGVSPAAFARLMHPSFIRFNPETGMFEPS
jgi:curved DNA-binding protein CbpA